jgi:hypothetical protein
MSPYFRIYTPGTFFLSLCQTCQLAGSLENFCEVPQFEKGGAKSSFSFQDFLEFLKATFVLN